MNIRKTLVTVAPLLIVLPLLGNAEESQKTSNELKAELSPVITSAMKAIDNGDIELSSSDQKMVAFQLAEAATAEKLYGVKK